MNLEKILKNDKRIWDEDILDYPQLFELARIYDKELLETLFNNKDSKEKFFIQVGDSHVFKYNEFRFYLEENQVNNSFTQYANKIGLASQGEYLSDSTDYVLDWPYKDCVLEGGMSSEEDMDVYIKRDEKTTPGKMDKKTGTVISLEKTEVTFSQAKRKREEIFYNNIIADKEIDRLLDKKALKNYTRYTAKGEEKVKEIKRDEDGTIKENLLIKGNNLLALHSLKEQFAGKVKLIYIDPPYNTGKDGFGYNDKFTKSTWLTFMKNRLSSAKSLLSEDGVIWVQLDDRLSHYCKIMMDEVFGSENFVSNIIWQKKYSPSNDSKWISDNHDHILVFAKNKSVFRPNLLERTEEMNKRYKNLDDDHRGPWKPGGFSVKTYSANYDYPIKTPSGRTVFPPKGSCWSTSQENYKKLLDDNRIYFGKNNDAKPQIKQFLSEVQQGVVSKSIWLHDEVGHNQISRSEITKLFGDYVFTTPKPEKLLSRIIHLSTNSGDIVLDFHLGSGTTSAVAHKMGRQSIGIEQMDYIEEVSLERFKKVIKGEDGGISKEVDWKGGGDFIYFELAEYNEEAKNKIDACKSYKDLKKLFTELTDYYFLNYNVSVKQFNDQLLDDKDFQELPLEEQKTLFKALLDNNQLYIPYKEQEDGKYNLSKEDQELTNEFYG